MNKALRIVVSGRVQGVWFRASTKQKADELGLAGIVKNQRDGTVYIEVQGDANSLDQFVSWCHKGPQFAEVKQLNITEIELKELDQFQILRNKMI